MLSRRHKERIPNWRLRFHATHLFLWVWVGGLSRNQECTLKLGETRSARLVTSIPQAVLQRAAPHESGLSVTLSYFPCSLRMHQERFWIWNAFTKQRAR